MNKLKEWMNPKYTKIAVYAIVAAAIVFGICLLLYYNVDAFRSGWKLCGAILKPLIIGLLITYLLSPLVKFLENKVFFKVSSSKARRGLSVLTIYLVILAALVVALVLLAVMVTKNLAYLQVSNLQDFISYMQNEFTDFWNEVIGILTGIGIFIPFLGPIIGFSSLIIICFVKGLYMKMIVGGIILACIMFLDSKLVNPNLLSKNVEVHPVLVFLALIAGEQIGGLTGMLVAVPCAAFLKEQFEKYMAKRELAKAENSELTTTDSPSLHLSMRPPLGSSGFSASERS